MSVTSDTSRIEQVVYDALENFGAERAEISREASFEQLDVDSLDLVEVVRILEDHYGIEIVDEKLEGIADSFKGVSKSFALQAGREIRILVESQKVSDEEAIWLSKDIARRIESELEYPGHIKVTVIRETRAVDYAK